MKLIAAAILAMAAVTLFQQPGDVVFGAGAQAGHVMAISVVRPPYSCPPRPPTPDPSRTMRPAWIMCPLQAQAKPPLPHKAGGTTLIPKR